MVKLSGGKKKYQAPVSYPFAQLEKVDDSLDDAGVVLVYTALRTVLLPTTGVLARTGVAVEPSQ